LPQQIPENVGLSEAITILEVARRLGRSLDLDELLDLIVDETRDVLNCERASLFLYDPQRRELYSKIAHGVSTIRLSVDRGISGACARTRKLINVPDVYADPRFNPDVDRESGYRTRNLLSCPLISYEGDLVGVLQAINKHQGGFDSGDEWLLETFSSQAAIALQRAKLLQEYAEKQRLERELDLAREIQEGLLPKELPQLPNYQIVGWNKPAEQTGGDCYDFIQFDARHVGVLLADASGHGIAPALIVAQLRAMLRALLLGTSMEQSKVIKRANSILCHDLPPDRFVTAFCGILHLDRNELVYCSAGQGPVLHVKAAEHTVEQFNATACPLGILPDLEFHLDQPIRFGPQDVLLLVTDGFFEWTNRQDVQFGLDRLSVLALELVHLDAADILNGIRERVVEFSAGTDQEDDLTAVVIKRVN